MKVLRALAEHLNREVHLEPMLRGALPLIVELCHFSAGWIFLVGEDGRFKLAASRGLPPALAADEGQALLWQPCQCQELFLAGKLPRATNVLECDRLEEIRTRLLGASEEILREQTGGLRYHATVPLRTGEVTFGLLNVAAAGTEPLDSETLELLAAVGQTLAVAMERVTLFQLMEEAREEETAAARALASGLVGLVSLEEIAEATLRVMRRFFVPDALSFLCLDPSGKFLELVAGWGWSENQVGRILLPLEPASDSGPAHAIRRREPILDDYAATASLRQPGSAWGEGVKLSLSIPMLAGDRPVGALVADYVDSREISREQLRFAALIGEIVAGAVERALEHRRYRTLFEMVPVGLYRSTPDGRLLDVNEAMVRLLGYPDRSALLATNAVKLYANPSDRARWQELVEREGSLLGFEVQWVRADGSIIWVLESARTVRDAAGRPLYYEGAAEDITARKRLETHLLYLASHDPLTGTLSRSRFQEELSRQLARIGRGEKGALLFLDLDNFKAINDALGHAAGDEILRGVAGVLRSQLREADVIGRMGGDEFAVLLPGVELGQAVAVAERLLAALKERVLLVGGRPLRPTASCGLALFPQHGVTADELLAAADLSLYIAKWQGGDRVQVFSPDALDEKRLEAPWVWGERIARAIAEGCLAAYFQPILDLKRGRTDRYELLARIREGDEVMEPAAFLPAAERLDYVTKIDLWMLERALAVAHRRGVVVHVNISSKTLADEGSLEAVTRAIQASGATARRLALELVETATVADLEHTMRAVSTLRAAGCQLALDDFGIGFSSLYLVRHLPVDYLKIDGSFIRSLQSDPQNQAIVKAIVELARGLGRSTIAESVEDAGTLEMVRSLGVDYAQGFHIARPAPLDGT